MVDALQAGECRSGDPVAFVSSGRKKVNARRTAARSVLVSPDDRAPAGLTVHRSPPRAWCSPLPEGSMQPEDQRLEVGSISALPVRPCHWTPVALADIFMEQYELPSNFE
jgi:hypothetical protein